ncbi:DUF6473 family protein [Ruegeria sp. Ofav3-42]|uniref:DUF6473 family protein n=1 Tax=Ruegeria sp. Ofav3-42 TaxID=2917759 RepID=UPI001EF3E559|nr:DUF6473 family protein [Ruegeria sp. Ofav3-42]MCG7522067.1 DUF6473 family protein [Ruegeria sp. Ofav3-42]
MSYHQTGSGEPGHDVCQYDGSRLWFRGARRVLDWPYMACAGGDETYGRFVERPFAAILEERLERRILNLGCLFSGVDALCHDRGLFELLNGADICVVQAPGLLGQSNRFYRVHPRRNDRFLAPTQDLRNLYPELDYTDVHFVRHLLTCLQGFHDARFEVVVDELRRGWIRQVGDFLQRLKAPVVLLRLQVLRDAEGTDHPEIAKVCVTDQMIEAIGVHCVACVDLKTQVCGQSDELEDMLFGTMQQPMAEHMIGPAAHRAIAAALTGPVRNLH